MSVQNPLSTLDEPDDAVRRVLARMDGPTVMAGQSFAGTIVSEVGNEANVSAIVFIAARAPGAGGDYAALGKKFPMRLRLLASSSTATREGSVRRPC